MEFALILGPVFPTREELASKDAFDWEMKFCAAAHATGYDGVSLNHHYLVGPEAQCFQPLPMATHVMTKYPSLYVMTTVFILPYHNPVEVAEQIATIDMISPGKFLFGVGQGYREKEAAALGIKHADRRGRMAESIKAMRMLWAEGPADFQGEYFKLANADIGARPVNGKGPPIIVAADKVGTVARVPKLGADYWLPSARHSKPFLREALPAYKKSLEEVGRKFDGIPLQRDMCVAKDERTAQAIVEKSYERMLHMQSRWGQPGERYNLPFNQLKEERVILGNPQKCAEELVAVHREFGAEFVLFRLYTPGMDPKSALEMTEQVGKEVLPLVRKEVGTRSLFGPPRKTH